MLSVKAEVFPVCAGGIGIKTDEDVGELGCCLPSDRERRKNELKWSVPSRESFYAHNEW